MRRMWLQTSEVPLASDFSVYRKRHKVKCGFMDLHKTIPVFIVPATPEAMELLVEKVARAIHGGSWTFDVGPDSSRDAYYDDARAALSAVFGKGGKP